MNNNKDVNKLAEDNMSLAYWVANKWNKKTSVPLEDLQSAALFGLAKASLSYDSSKAANFATYSTTIMENEIRTLTKKHIKREERFQVKDIDPSEVSTYTEEDIHDSISLRQAISKLPKESVEIFTAIYVDNLTQKEVAATYGLTLRQLKSELEEIKDFLRYQLNG